MAKEKTMIQIGDELFELKGAELEAFEADRKTSRDEQAIIEANNKTKQEARESAITKLGEIAGLTKDELNAIL